MTDKLWRKLDEDLRTADVDDLIPDRMSWGDAVDDDSVRHAANVLLNSDVTREPFEDILIAYLRHPLRTVGLEIVVRLLTRKGAKSAVPNLLRLYQQVPQSKSEQSTLWAVGNAIYTIAPKTELDQIIEICRNHKLGKSRHQLVVHLSRFKKNDSVFEILIELLADQSIVGPALEALKRYGDPRAIATIEATDVDEDDVYPAHQKKMALKKLNEKLAN